MPNEARVREIAEAIENTTAFVGLSDGKRLRQHYTLRNLPPWLSEAEWYGARDEVARAIAALPAAGTSQSTEWGRALEEAAICAGDMRQRWEKTLAKIPGVPAFRGQRSVLESAISGMKAVEVAIRAIAASPPAPASQADKSNAVLLPLSDYLALLDAIKNPKLNPELAKLLRSKAPWEPAPSSQVLTEASIRLAAKEVLKADKGERFQIDHQQDDRGVQPDEWEDFAVAVFDRITNKDAEHG